MIDFTTTRDGRPSRTEAAAMAKRAEIVAKTRARDFAAFEEASLRSTLAAAARKAAKGAA